MKFIAGLHFSADLRRAARHSLASLRAPPRDLSLLCPRLPRAGPITMYRYHRLPHGRAWSAFGARSNLPMRAGLPKHRRVCPLVAARRFAWRSGSTSPARQMATSALRSMGALCRGPDPRVWVPTQRVGAFRRLARAAKRLATKTPLREPPRATIVAPPASPVRPD